MAGGRGCQEQQQQQEGIKGALDGAAANDGEAERGEGRGARDSLVRRGCKEKERRGQGRSIRIQTKICIKTEPVFIWLPTEAVTQFFELVSAVQYRKTGSGLIQILV